VTTRIGSATLTRFVVASRYMPVYIAFALLILISIIWVPNAFSSVAVGTVASLGPILGIAALGQMLVVMTGGIDLSTPATLTFAMVIVTGVGMQSDARIGLAIIVALGVAGLIGLVNGVLIGGFKLNALIVTLAVGQVTVGVINRYGRTFPVQTQAPSAWIEWTTSRSLGVSNVFWVGAGITRLLILGFRYTAVGRRFQGVGANPVAAQVVGIRVNLHQILVYVVAALFYAAAGVALAGLLRTPGVAVNNQYLLGPIAAVVIGGASLTGGLASSGSTFVAAIFLTGLSQLMRTMGLGTALQFVVFGVVIIGGMLVSGYRIFKAVERTLRERRRPDGARKQEIDNSDDGPG
jgi:ribose transport system permease protein